MTALLKPSRPPHPDLLVKALGATCTSAMLAREAALSFSKGFAEAIARLVGAARTELEEEHEQDGSFFKRFLLEPLRRQASPLGRISVNYKDGGRCSLHVEAPWGALPAGVEQIIRAFDAVWSAGECAALYVYDQDDYALQNHTMTLGLEEFGLDPKAVAIVKNAAGLDEIDISENPGVLRVCNGIPESIQWLNYWSVEAQAQLFRTIPASWPPGVLLRHLENGTLSLLLGDRPGSYDDVKAHRLQLECRKLFGLKRA